MSHSVRVRSQRLALAIAQRHFFADQRGRIGGLKFLGEILEQDDFFGVGAGEELALQAVEGFVLARRHGQAGDKSEMRFVVVDDLAHHANFRLDLGDVLQLRHLEARRLVEHGSVFGMLVLAILVAIEVAGVLLGSDEDGVEHAGAGETARGELLQSDAERQHRDQRRDANGDADGGEAVAQLGLAQVAHGEIEQVVALHARASSAPVRPSPGVAGGPDRCRKPACRRRER